MNIISVVVGVLTGGGAAIAVVVYLSKQLVEHILAKDLEDKKKEILHSLEEKKASLQSSLEERKTSLQFSLEEKKNSLQLSLEDKKGDLQKTLEEKKNDLQQVLEKNKIEWKADSDKILQLLLEEKKGDLQKTLEEKRNDLQQVLERNKIEWKADSDKMLQEYLGEKSAELEYQLEARKRLYHSIGPLRFQLLVSCKEVASRIDSYGKHPYNMGLGGYYGRRTLYKLLRPLTVAELIERQIAYSDFFVDEQGREMLRFQQASFAAFTDGDPILRHPNTDWNHEIEHLYSGTLRNLANMLVIPDENINSKERPMHYHEFDKFVKDPRNSGAFSPLSDFLGNFKIDEKAIFWIRLVCFGYICNEYVEILGGKVGFKKVPFDAKKLLLLSSDPYISSNIDKYQQSFDSLVNMTL